MLIKALAIIFWTCICRWLFIQAFMSPLPFIQIHNIETGGYVILCYILLCNEKTPFRWIFLFFVITHTLLMFYAFLPDDIRTAPVGAPKTYVDIIKEWFYYIWTMIAIFTLIVHKHKKLA